MNDFFSDSLLQMNFENPKEIQKKEFGKKLITQIWARENANTTSLNFFTARNERWAYLLKWAKGSQDMTEFLDLKDVSDGNKSYSNIDLTQSRLAPKFLYTLIESMAKTREYPCVDAVDDGSIKEKENRKFNAIRRMQDIEEIIALQEKTGVQVENPNDYVPNDELSAEIYFKIQDQLPKEIRFQEMLNKCLLDNEYERVLKRKGLFYLTALNIEAVKIEKSAKGKISYIMPLPQSLIYNFFISDNGKKELTDIGYQYRLKVRDIRNKFGKNQNRPNGVTEKEIFELAKTSSQKSQTAFNFDWIEDYNNSYLRPYDDASILVVDMEINVPEMEYYVAKKDKYGKENISVKIGIPVVNSEKSTVLRKNKKTFYRGVYAPYGDIMLYWGLPEFSIRPYTDLEECFSSWCINIPNNDGEYVPSLFERILEPIKEYQIAKLKRKNLISNIRPSGIRIDVESARNLDLGNGDSIGWDEVVRIYNATGNELWSSRGLDPNQREAPPISNTSQDLTVQKIIELTNVLASIVNEIRDLLGVPMYRDGSDVGERTAARLAEGQNLASYNVTDFIPNAHYELWEDVLRKTCILKWNDVINEKEEGSMDYINTVFDVNIKFKSTDYEKQLLENDIQMYSQTPDKNGNPLISPKDALMLRNIDDYKLASMYMANVIEQNKREAILDAERLQAQASELNKASSEQALKEAQMLQAEKLTVESKIKELEAKNKSEQILLQGILDIYKTTGGILPKELQQIGQLVLTKVGTELGYEMSQEQAEIEAVSQEQDQLMQQQMEEKGVSPEEMQQLMQQEQGQEMPQEQVEEVVMDEDMQTVMA